MAYRHNRCTLCNRPYANEHSLKRHLISVHLSIKDHICAICGKGFPTSSGLDQHRFSHVTAKLFKCDKCTKSYKSFSSLCRHKRTINHNGIVNAHSTQPGQAMFVPDKCDNNNDKVSIYEQVEPLDLSVPRVEHATSSTLADSVNNADTNQNDRKRMTAYTERHYAPKRARGEMFQLKLLLNRRIHQ